MYISAGFAVPANWAQDDLSIIQTHGNSSAQMPCAARRADASSDPNAKAQQNGSDKTTVLTLEIAEPPK